LKLLGLERGQDVAQMIVGGRAILERAKAAKQLKLFDPEQSDLSEALGAREHGEQTQKQDLIERVADLTGLAMV